MIENRILAILGKIPFDLAIRNVRVVNVFNNEIKLLDIGIVGDTIAYVGTMGAHHRAVRTYDGEGKYALPGFVDAHMHLESSMMIPANFAKAVIACGTTTVAADPHEIANVMGQGCGSADEGYRRVAAAGADLCPLHHSVPAGL